jgi:hypothetical protein
MALVLAGCLWIGPWSPAARAAEAGAPQVVDLTYDVYLGGLHIFSFGAELVSEPGRYQVSAAGVTSGLVGVLYSWDIKLAAEGVDENGRVAAMRYTTDSAWKGKRKVVELAYRDGGRYDLAVTPPPEPDPDIEGGLPDTLPEGIADPLTMALAAARSIDETMRCDQTIPVFDGQRRYDVTLGAGEPATLPANTYAIYAGAALRCTVAINRISGFRKSARYTKQMEADSSAAPGVWLAKLHDGVPPLPVRYEGASALGSMIVHLTAIEVRTQPEQDVP